VDIDRSYSSVETAAVLRRARDLVEVVQPSDRLAFAVLQLELGHDLEVVREKLQLDADQLAAAARERADMLRAKLSPEEVAAAETRAQTWLAQNSLFKFALIYPY
jgi:hypothetical protein